MNIIQKQPNQSGAYPPIQEFNGENAPDTHYEVVCDYSEFYNGFIIPTIEDGKVTSYACNTEAWEAWKASLPPEPEPQPDVQADTDAMIVDLEYRVTLLEMGVN